MSALELFTIAQADWDRLCDVIQREPFQPLLMIGGLSRVERIPARVMEEWRRLGAAYGFDPETVVHHNEELCQVRAVRAPATRDGIIDRARTQLAEIAQYFTDLEHWNAHRKADEEPIDPDPDGQIASIRAMLQRAVA